MLTYQEIRESILNRDYCLEKNEVDFVIEYFLYVVLPGKFIDLYVKDPEYYRGYHMFFMNGGDNTPYCIAREIIPGIMVELLKYTKNWEEIGRCISGNISASIGGSHDDLDDKSYDIIDIVENILLLIDDYPINMIKGFSPKSAIEV